MESPKISRSKIFLSIILLVIFGATIGSLGTAWYLERRVQSLLDLGPVGTRKLIMIRLKKELGLTSEQAQKLENSVETAQNSYAELRNLHKSEIDVITQSVTNESRQILTAEQQIKFDQIRAKFLNRNPSPTSQLK